MDQPLIEGLFREDRLVLRCDSQTREVAFPYEINNLVMQHPAARAHVQEMVRNAIAEFSQHVQQIRFEIPADWGSLTIPTPHTLHTLADPLWISLEIELNAPSSPNMYLYELVEEEDHVTIILMKELIVEFLRGITNSSGCEIEGIQFQDQRDRQYTLHPRDASPYQDAEKFGPSERTRWGWVAGLVLIVALAIGYLQWPRNPDPVPVPRPEMKALDPTLPGGMDSTRAPDSRTTLQAEDYGTVGDVEPEKVESDPAVQPPPLLSEYILSHFRLDEIPYLTATDNWISWQQASGELDSLRANVDTPLADSPFKSLRRKRFSSVQMVEGFLRSDSLQTARRLIWFRDPEPIIIWSP